MKVTLVEPFREGLPSFIAALERGFAPNTTRPESTREELDAIAADAEGYLGRQVDREAKGGPVTLPDGSRVARLPGYRLWIWDGECAGMVNFRWVQGTAELPPHVLGHIGYAVVEWKRGRGYATEALRLLLERVREESLPWVELTTDVDNVASQKVIASNGGRLVERFRKPAAFGGSAGLRYRIPL